MIVTLEKMEGPGNMGILKNLLKKSIAIHFFL